MAQNQLWIACALALGLLSCSRGNPCTFSSQPEQCNLMQQLQNIEQDANQLASDLQQRVEEEVQKMMYNTDDDVSEEIDIYLRNRRSASTENIISNNNIEGSAGFRDSDVLDLADLEMTLSRSNRSKVVMFRGNLHLKINGSFVETNEGSRKLLKFIHTAKSHAGGPGFNTTSSDESEGLGTHRLETVLRSRKGRKKENRYEVSYWLYKFQPGAETQDVLEKYEVVVRCQPSPPGHTLNVNGYHIVSGTNVWWFTINEACRFWRA